MQAQAPNPAHALDLAITPVYISDVTGAAPVMCFVRNPKRKVLLVRLAVLVSGLLLIVGYAYQKSRFVQRSNALFDLQEKAFTGVFLPWPIGSPTLAGGLNRETDRRIRAALGYESGSISTNGMTLIIHDSAGSFLIHDK